MFWLLGGVSCWVNRSVVGDCVQDVGDGVPCLTAVAKEIALRVHDGACFVERCCTWLLVRLLGFSVTDYTIPCFFA